MFFFLLPVSPPFPAHSPFLPPFSYLFLLTRSLFSSPFLVCPCLSLRNEKTFALIRKSQNPPPTLTPPSLKPLFPSPIPKTPAKFACYIHTKQLRIRIPIPTPPPPPTPPPFKIPISSAHTYLSLPRTHIQHSPKPKF